MTHSLDRRTLLGVLALGAALVPVIGRGQEPTKAQPELAKQKLVIIGHDGTQHVFNVEIARTDEEQTTGLMFRPSVPADGGMLFVWPQAQESRMWMRNTIAALDMVFINADGTIRHITEDTVPQSLAIIDSHGPVRATLELAAGTAKRLDLRVGDKVLAAALGTAA